MSTQNERTYAVITRRTPEILVSIPLRSTRAAVKTANSAPTQRDWHSAMVHPQGWLNSRPLMAVGQHALVESNMGQYKALTSTCFRRSISCQDTEAAMSVAVFNGTLAPASALSVRCRVRARAEQRCGEEGISFSSFSMPLARPSATMSAQVAFRRSRTPSIPQGHSCNPIVRSGNQCVIRRTEIEDMHEGKPTAKDALIMAAVDPIRVCLTCHDSTRPPNGRLRQALRWV